MIGTVRLNNGVHMPQIGMGTGCTHGSYTVKNVLHALSEGYTLFDTASTYGTEECIGEGIRVSGVEREDVFVGTKLWPTDYGYENTKKAFETSLKNLQMDYIDLYLVNWPAVPSDVENKKQCLEGTWKALEEIYKEGRCRAIGVSNYLQEDLEELFTYCTIKPHVNQLEFHPYCYPHKLKSFCDKHNIVVTGYSPLAKAEIIKRRLLCISFEELAKKYDKSIAQILIRWNIQHNVVVIPKTTNSDRAVENINVFDFELTELEMEELNGLSDTIAMSVWEQMNATTFQNFISTPPSCLVNRGEAN